jgi:hypothetical protein
MRHGVGAAQPVHSLVAQRCGCCARSFKSSPRESEADAPTKTFPIPMKIVLVCSTLTVGVALSGCALEPAGPSPYGYAGAPYEAPGASSYWSSPYYAPYAPYGYAGSTLGFGAGGEGWHERDRDWRRHDHDWHREGTGEGHHQHQPERSLPGSVAATPPTHAAPPPAHAAPARPAPPSASSAKEKPLPPFHGSAF